MVRSVRTNEDYALLSCQITMQRAAGHSIDLYRKQSCTVKLNHKRLFLFNPYCHQCRGFYATQRAPSTSPSFYVGKNYRSYRKIVHTRQAGNHTCKASTTANESQNNTHAKSMHKARRATIKNFGDASKRDKKLSL